MKIMAVYMYAYFEIRNKWPSINTPKVALLYDAQNQFWLQATISPEKQTSKQTNKHTNKSTFTKSSTESTLLSHGICKSHETIAWVILHFTPIF